MSARRLDGVLLLDKPLGMTSSAAVQRVKRLYRARKAGHAGTLDPLASGVLLVLFGEATKFAGFGLEAAKEYVADVQLGVATRTGDAEGEVTGRRPVQVGGEDLERALARFRGTIAQVPPMYSALKHGGQPLYALARAGRAVERAARAITVHALELLDRDGERLRLRILCSKGTY
ncbi:MAG: tRNA pseudouridine(55) synthase TruB, partial [Pseudomonadota bacterium]